jgi:CRISPR-associated protein Cas1
MNDALSAALPPELARQQWVRLNLTLINTRNTFAREAPAFIFWAFLKHAARGMGSEQHPFPFVFHDPDRRLMGRMHLHSRWNLRVVFPHASLPEVGRFLGRLERHAEEREANFSLQDASVEPRRLADVLAESCIPTDAPLPELCLDFSTPFPFARAEGDRRWMISAAVLWRYVQMRARAVLGEAAPLPADPPPGRTLPYYWEYAELKHKAKSGPGMQYLNGCRGPLYLRGEDLRPWLPWLALAAEFHLHPRNGSAGGHFALAHRRPWFDPQLGNPQLYAQALTEWAAQSDQADEVGASAFDPLALGQALAEEVSRGTYQPEPAEAVTVEKPRGGQRLLALFPPRDRVLQGALHALTGPVFDRMFESVSMGYRPGRSTQSAREAINSALREGYTHLLETDIASFFDEVDWDRLDRKLHEALPLEDVRLRALLRAVVHTPLRLHGEPVRRGRGLLQGAVMSPLLANLYLDSLDEALLARQYRLVRYADDFVVLTRGRREAEECLAFVREQVAALGLSLKEEKTAIRDVSEGFSFVGFDWGADWSDDAVERSELRKPLYVTEPYCMVGVDHQSVELRKSGKLLERFPLHRLGEITLLGPKVLSTRLVEVCARRGIALTLCSPLGARAQTLQPRTRAHFQTAVRQARQFETEGEEGRLRLARRLIQAKIHNYLYWFRHTRVDRNARDLERLDGLLADLEKCADLDKIRGYEGAAAQICFHAVNRRVKIPEFRSERRVPHFRPDRYNAMLDFAYHLLANRVNALTRSAGLNPYLGFVHSPEAPYESLVYDLVEPFRARVDRLVVRLINRAEIRPEDVTPGTDGKFSHSRDTLAKFIEAFEVELATQLAGDHAALRTLMRAQIYSLRMWAEHGDVFRVYQVGVGMKSLPQVQTGEAGEEPGFEPDPPPGEVPEDPNLDPGMGGFRETPAENEAEESGEEEV